MSEVTAVTARLDEHSEGLQFLGRLRHLSRGERAILRRNAGRTIAEARNAAGLFYRILPPVHKAQEEIYFLVATLYGYNDRSHRGDLGATLRDVKAAAGSESIDRRMAILLDAAFDRGADGCPGGGELSYRVWQAVKLAASRQVGVNWELLLKDLLAWSYPEKRVQKRWARSYFQQTAADESGVQPEQTKEGGQ